MISFDVLMPIAALLVVLTNVITQVIKKVTWDKLPTNILCVIISMAITIATGFAYCQIQAVTITWYFVIAIIVAGFVVAYAAMFGFDKLVEVIDWIKAKKVMQTKAEAEEGE